MVSRFPDGSPIIWLDPSERALIATFNKNINTADLVGKLKAVVYLDNGISYDATAGFDDEDFGLIIENVGHVGLEIEGKNLYVTTDSVACYIFDIDYDQQHKKIWDINNATYLLEIPDLILPGSTTHRYLEVDTVYTPTGALNFSVIVNNLNVDEGYLPRTNTTELDSEQTGSWFNNGSGSTNWGHIESLIKKILLIEYNLQAEEITIVAENGPYGVDGGMLNLFNDGSPYVPVVPLQMVTRIPNGIPVEVGASRKLVATFNRSFTMQELVGKIVLAFAYTTPSSAVAQLSNLVTSTQNEGVISNLDNTESAKLIIDRTNLYVMTNNVHSGHIFDCDYDQQHRRTLTAQESAEPLLYYINTPTLDVNIVLDKICIYVYQDDMLYVQPVRMPDETLACYDGQHMPPRGIQADLMHILDLLELILKIEFSNFNDMDIAVELLSQDTQTMTAGVDLLSVSVMPAP